MTEDMSRLAEAVQDRYTLQRELGRGGMATVYLATDVRHGRPVALKVLRPELAAALGPERFLREITVTAQLDHPNIVPLYDSGQAGSPAFLYYTMPFVEGESLRDRLEREGPLPLPEGLQLAREIAEALSYAHSRGLVHRDIKPENILLAGGHARVADFGIARAVSEAGGTNLTGTGVSIGTPAYMSPEQAEATRPVDARSDVYSLGCVVYEMLTGHAPFHGVTGHELLARHALDPVPPLRTGRATIPEAVEAAVERALAKVPADRFATAHEFAAALTLDPAVSGVRQPVRPRRRVRTGLLLAAAVPVLFLSAVGARWFLETGRPGTVFASGALDPGDRVLLADFVNRTEDSLLGDAVREGLRALLADPRVVSLVDRGDVREGRARMGLGPDDRLYDTRARELAEREAAKAYLTGEVSRLGSGYQMTAQLLETRSDAVLLTERVTARDSGELIQALDRLGRRLRRGIGESLRGVVMGPSLPRVTTSSLAALRLFGEAYYQPGARALPLLYQAAEIDSTFAMAYHLIASFEGNAGRLAEQRAAADRALALRDRLPEKERLIVEASWGPSDGREQRWSQLLAVDPENRVARVFLTDIRLQQRRWAEAESIGVDLLDRGAHLNRITVYNPIEAQLAQGRFGPAEALLSRLPLEKELGEDLRVGVLLARRDWRAAQRFMDSTGGRDAYGINYAAAVAAQGRLVEAARVLPGTFGARLWWVSLVSRYTGDTARGARILDEALTEFQSRWDRWPPTQRPYESLFFALLEVGREARARATLEEWKSHGDPRLQCDSALFAGGLAVADGQMDRAAEAFLAWHRAGFCTGTHLVNKGLVEAAMAFDRAGRADTALVLYERALAGYSLDGHLYEVEWYPLTLRRMGELHEALGHRTEALERYQQFVDLWAAADPELQPQVAEVRQRMVHLLDEAR